MKCYFVIREDLTYSSDRLFKIAVRSQNLIEQNKDEWLENPKSEVYMMYNIVFLYKLEEKLIEDGVYFKWIEEYNTTIGILIEPTDDYEIPKKYLDDCITLEQYAKFRPQELNELKERIKYESVNGE